MRTRVQDLDSCRMRLDPELGRHRYERKISFAGILDDEDGHDSLNSSSHTLKSDTTGDDKKPPETQGEPRPRPPSACSVSRQNPDDPASLSSSAHP